MEANTTDCDQDQPYRCYNFATIIDPPYVMEKEDGSGQYEGLVVDLLHKLADTIGFRFRLKVARGTYGHLEPNGTWTGLIGNVNTLPADMVVGAMAVTPERAGVLQMTESFHSSSVQLLLLRPRRRRARGGASTGPLHSRRLASGRARLRPRQVGIGRNVGLFLIGRFSPRKTTRASPEDTHRARHGFGLKNSFLFTVSALTWQGYRESPKSLSGRVLAVSWWFFVVLILLAYLSNLTALVSLRPHLRPALPFRTYRDILRDKSMQVAMVRNGDAHQELKRSDDTLEKQLLEYVTSRQNLFTTIPEALQRMRQFPFGRLALLVPTYKARHLTSYQCDLISHGHGLGMIQYAFGMPAGIHLEAMKRRINSAILVLRETGELDELSRKWQNRGSNCPDPEGSSLPVNLEGGSSLPFLALGPRDLAIAFLVLLLCALLAAGLAGVEIVHGRRLYKRDSKKHEKTELASKPFFTKGSNSDHDDVVIVLDGEEGSGPEKSGKNNVEKNADQKYLDRNEGEKVADHDVTSAQDGPEVKAEGENTSGCHDVTVHQAE